MIILMDFVCNLDKKSVLNSIQCYETNPLYDEISGMYEQMLTQAKELSRPRAAYFVGERLVQFNFSEVHNCSKIVYCLLTLGQEVSSKAGELFTDGLYLESVLLDAIADGLLFSYSGQLYETIKLDMQTQGLGLTRRLSPGEGKAIDLSFQKDILNLFQGENSLGVTITDGYMLNPVKSSAFFYGADENQAMSSVDHDCSHCDDGNCTRRKSPFGNKEVQVLVVKGQQEYRIMARTSQSILEILVQGKIDLAAPCNGRGSCGKCKVKIIRGNAWFNANNFEKLQKEELRAGICLACSSYPMDDCTISMDLVNEENFSTAVAFTETSTALIDSGITVTKFTLDAAAVKSGASLTQIVECNLGENYQYSLSAVRKLATLINPSAQGQCKHCYSGLTTVNLIIENHTVIDLQSGDDAAILGIGIDIGTTTVVLSLVNLLSGEICATYSLLNSQRKFGADVISRIQHSSQGNIRVLQELICTDIVNGIAILAKDRLDTIYHITIAGNTTMLHLLLGFPVESLGVYPFTTTTTKLLEYRFSDIFTHDLLQCKVTILPGVSAYVGADIVAGMLACHFDTLTKTSLLIDIGTNGEMVIGNKDKIVCLATAAGPAFEGANIACGTGSITGAIATFDIQDGGFVYSTIDNGEPLGICGSGVIDIAAACLRKELMDETGRFDETKISNGRLEIFKGQDGRGIFFNQKDIRELQLAKAAIRSGIELLVKSYNCTYEDIDTVYLAGGFGSNINIDNAAAIGLIPQELANKVKTVGNSSLGGAVQYLLHQQNKEKIASLVTIATFMDLSSNAAFNDLFIENMLFE